MGNRHCPKPQCRECSLCYFCWIIDRHRLRMQGCTRPLAQGYQVDTTANTAHLAVPGGLTPAAEAVGLYFQLQPVGLAGCSAIQARSRNLQVEFPPHAQANCILSQIVVDRSLKVHAKPITCGHSPTSTDCWIFHMYRPTMTSGVGYIRTPSLPLLRPCTIPPSFHHPSRVAFALCPSLLLFCSRWRRSSPACSWHGLWMKRQSLSLQIFRRLPADRCICVAAATNCWMHPTCTTASTLQALLLAGCV